jgi:hypothetical protein
MTVERRQLTKLPLEVRQVAGRALTCYRLVSD